ncbi:hypothetical protein NDU88_004667 [Pleurodeles waltl]|uniref:Uncharacterized protein n=1 Tax=Pleurodeles waltl TaxID=8319 RepID=A0AAV7PHD0_PLEWA|nr:hypothetical protein NDU88_004667 [Pleurodeles waltl]
METRPLWKGSLRRQKHGLKNSRLQCATPGIGVDAYRHSGGETSTSEGVSFNSGVTIIGVSSEATGATTAKVSKVEMDAKIEVTNDGDVCDEEMVVKSSVKTDGDVSEALVLLNIYEIWNEKILTYEEKLVASAEKLPQLFVVVREAMAK